MPVSTEKLSVDSQLSYRFFGFKYLDGSDYTLVLSPHCIPSFLASQRRQGDCFTSCTQEISSKGVSIHGQQADTLHHCVITLPLGSIVCICGSEGDAFLCYSDYSEQYEHRDVHKDQPFLSQSHIDHFPLKDLSCRFLATLGTTHIQTLVSSQERSSQIVLGLSRLDSISSDPLTQQRTVACQNLHFHSHSAQQQAKHTTMACQEQVGSASVVSRPFESPEKHNQDLFFSWDASSILNTVSSGQVLFSVCPGAQFSEGKPDGHALFVYHIHEGSGKGEVTSTHRVDTPQITVESVPDAYKYQGYPFSINTKALIACAGLVRGLSAMKQEMIPLHIHCVYDSHENTYLPHPRGNIINLEGKVRFESINIDFTVDGLRLQCCIPIHKNNRILAYYNELITCAIDTMKVSNCMMTSNIPNNVNACLFEFQKIKSILLPHVLAPQSSLQKLVPGDLDWYDQIMQRYSVYVPLTVTGWPNTTGHCNDTKLYKENIEKIQRDMSMLFLEQRKKRKSLEADSVYNNSDNNNVQNTNIYNDGQENLLDQPNTQHSTEVIESPRKKTNIRSNTGSGTSTSSTRLAYDSIYDLPKVSSTTNSNNTNNGASAQIVVKQQPIETTISTPSIQPTITSCSSSSSSSSSFPPTLQTPSSAMISLRPSNTAFSTQGFGSNISSASSNHGTNDNTATNTTTNSTTNITSNSTNIYKRVKTENPNILVTSSNTSHNKNNNPSNHLLPTSLSDFFSFDSNTSLSQLSTTNNQHYGTSYHHHHPGSDSEEDDTHMHDNEDESSLTSVHIQAYMNHS